MLLISGFIFFLVSISVLLLLFLLFFTLWLNAATHRTCARTFVSLGKMNCFLFEYRISDCDVWHLLYCYEIN